MSLVNPKKHEEVASDLKHLLSTGKDLGEALRELHSEHVGTLFLSQALQQIAGITSREAATIIAKEVTAQRP